MQSGETEIETLEREIMEETGRKVTGYERFFEFATKKARHVFYRTYVTEPAAAPTGEEYTNAWEKDNGTYELVWIGIDEIDRFDTSPPFLATILQEATKGTK